MTTQLLYGIVLIACDLRVVTRGAAISPIGVDASSLRLYDPFVGDAREPFGYGAKRDTDSPEEPDSKERRSNVGSSFIRFGRNHPRDAYAGESAFEARSPRGRSDNIIRFGRSSPKVSRHRAARGGGFERMLESESSAYARPGRKVPLLPSKAEMAILCPNLLVEEGARGSEDLQMYLARIVYACNDRVGKRGKSDKDCNDDDRDDRDDDANDDGDDEEDNGDDRNNNNNNNNKNVDNVNRNTDVNDNEGNLANDGLGNEGNTHRGNLDFLRGNGAATRDIARGFTI
ncbi:FMRFamide-related peptides-like [Athalia rosae]|uniref:FMRFamide-related peptides-like n=1 Tax=Athalia rosae TaxID=37344 RepID=UPI00203394F1|nr:FMRFamide-related peptides-like [Athalia rosae]